MSFTNETAKRAVAMANHGAGGGEHNVYGSTFVAGGKDSAEVVAAILDELAKSDSNRFVHIHISWDHTCKSDSRRTEPGIEVSGFLNVPHYESLHGEKDA